MSDTRRVSRPLVMDWQALSVSIELAVWTVALLIPMAILLARFLAWRRFPGRLLLESVIALPLVLPPSVLGFYFLLLFNPSAPLGSWLLETTGTTLVFSFPGLVLASIVYSLPFAVQPLLRAFESIPRQLREAAWCNGLSFWQTFLKIELPLARGGLFAALALSFAHTLGEFGVVLMVGGNIPGQTRTLAVAIYDRVQALDESAAGEMSLVLLGFSLGVVMLVFAIERRR